jgi:hypothetical protein
VSLGLFVATNLLAATSQRRYVIKQREESAFFGLSKNAARRRNAKQSSGFIRENP